MSWSNIGISCLISLSVIVCNMCILSCFYVVQFKDENFSPNSKVNAPNYCNDMLELVLCRELLVQFEGHTVTL